MYEDRLRETGTQKMRSEVASQAWEAVTHEEASHMVARMLLATFASQSLRQKERYLAS